MVTTPLDEMGTPLYFIAENAADAGFETPPNPHGQSLRTWVRALAGGMQKEALVVSAATGTAWRFACDEGGHLGGFNKAPNPLTYLSAGMVASYMNEITALADQRGISLSNLELALENFYNREGDFRKGTMMSGAMGPELTVHCEADCDEQTLNTLLYEAVAASPLNGLARGSHPSLFTLVHNGKTVTPNQVTPLDVEPFADPGDNFPKLKRLADTPAVDDLITMTMDEDSAREAIEGMVFPNAPKLPEGQQLLHMHTRCVLRPDGVKEIHKGQYGPVAPSWLFLSSEDGRAPDAASLISAGIGLCFMTQLGRYSHMAKLPLEGYRIIQDTHFSLGGASGKTGKAGEAMPVETHVFLDTGTDDETAQQILGVGERTCFLHAFCRDDIKAKVRSAKPAEAA
ncbi:MAG: OsmC family protein [Alphaproteobacteria bacterium]|jgi:uncharacterized OsmC-like protein|nr:OsmC family protein [Alphaproteobacteria bacterium]